jgi:hypothetical protein
VTHFIQPVLRGAALLAVAAFCADPIRAATPAMLVGADLTPVKVSVQSMSDGTLNYFDSERRLRSEPASSFLQIRFVSPALQQQNSDEPVGWLELIDGQRYPGRLTGADEAGQSIDWTLSLPTAVTMRVSLEQVRSLRWPLLSKPQAPAPEPTAANAPPQPAGALVGSPVNSPVRSVVDSPASRPPAGAVSTTTGDSVTLANGDRVSGFVQAIKLSGLELRAGSGTAALTLPIERLTEVTFSSVGAAASGTTTTGTQRVIPGAGTVVLRSGARLSGTELRVSGDASASVSLMLSLPGSVSGQESGKGMAVSLPVTQVERIELQSRAGSLVALSSLPLSIVEGGSVLGLPVLPRVEAGDWLLHAPLLANVELPQGTRRISMKLSLALPAGLSREAQGKPDFIVTLEQSGKTLAQVRINQQSPEQLINVAADAGLMRIKLDASLNGPVLDRLRITGGVVLVK